LRKIEKMEGRVVLERGKGFIFKVFGHLTFGHVFPKLVNFFGVNMMNEITSRFQSRLKKNINQTFEKFKECIVSYTLPIVSKTFFI
jgi:hypothetical protein